MGVRNALSAGGQLGRSLFAMCADGLALSKPLPLSPETIVHPDYLNALLQHDGLPASAALPEITATQLLDTRSISSNCNNRVLAVQYASPAEGNPQTLFLKIPLRACGTRLFLNVIRAWQLECNFYRHVAPKLSVRTPKAYLASTQGSRFVLLMEDLYAQPDVVLFNNPGMIKGLDLNDAQRCLQTLAKIHGPFHGISSAEQNNLLPAALQPYSSPVMRALTPMMARSAMARCRKRSDLSLAAHHLQWYDTALAHWDELVDHWSRGPLTLVHGDSHMGNHFLYEGGAGMLDWQAAQWGKGVRDVHYFLTDSLPADTLAANETSLLRSYLAELHTQGVDIDFSEAWQQYRGFSLQTWMTIIVSIGLGAMTADMDEVMPEIHRRCIASIERLDLGGWLDEVLN